MESTGSVSLKALFDGETEIDNFSTLTVEQIAFAIVRGGWPASIGKSEKIALRHAIDYVEAIINADVSRVDGIEKNPVRVRALLQSLYRRIFQRWQQSEQFMMILLWEMQMKASLENNQSVLKGIGSNICHREFPAWNPALRSKTAIRTSPKQQSVDPSIAWATSIGLAQDCWKTSIIFDFF